MIKLFSMAALSVIATGAFAQCNQLFFSEYLEGSSNNKAVEFYNPTNTTVNLNDYKVYRYNNGSPTPTDSLSPQGTLAPGAVFVAGNPSAVASILAVSDTLHTITFFNGDDALELVYIPTNTSLDVIGQIGVDPGTNWPVGTGATSEFTLVRMFGIQQGTTTWSQAQTEYDVFTQNTDTTLGHHYMQSCCVAPVVSLVSQVNNPCFGDASGSLQVTANGTGPFTYAWVNRPETSPSLAGLPAGTYTVVVTGSCGTDSLAVTITEPGLLTQTLAASTLPGCNQADGSLTVAVAGGTAPYTYMWSNGGITSTITSIGAGLYTCTVTCTNGCTSVANYTLQNSSPPTVSVSLSMDTLCQLPATPFALNGESPAGGTWSGNGVSGSTFFPDSVSAGWHIITYTYTDSMSCVGSAVDSIYVDLCSGISSQPENGFTLCPNPFGCEFRLTFSTSAARIVEVFNIHGEVIKSLSTTATQTSVDMRDEADGIYVVRVTDGSGYRQERVIKQ